MFSGHGVDRDSALCHSPGADALDVVFEEASGADASGAVGGAIVGARPLRASGEISDVSERLRRDAAKGFNDEGDDCIAFDPECIVVASEAGG